MTLGGRHIRGDHVRPRWHPGRLASGIEASVRAALDGLGIEHAASDGRLLAGQAACWPDRKRCCPTRSRVERELVTDAFMRHYDAIGWRSSEPYVGVASILERLRRGGHRLFVVTNKRRAPTVAILAHHGLSGFFEAVYTPDSRVPRYASKGEMGQACIDEHALTPSSTLVVGDSSDDRRAGSRMRHAIRRRVLGIRRCRLGLDRTGRRYPW